MEADEEIGEEGISFGERHAYRTGGQIESRVA